MTVREVTAMSEVDGRGLPVGYPLDEAHEVSPAAVRAMLDAGEPVRLLDCRTPKEYAAARIEGALLVPMQETPDRLDELDAWLDEKVVVFCHAGVRSMKVAQFLRERGFDDVKSMVGGIDLWSLTVDRSVPRY